jgi:CDP-paratose 2-epimerase
MKVLITGSSGSIGSEAVGYYDGQGHALHSLDHNMHREFFGPLGDLSEFKSHYPDWRIHHSLDRILGKMFSALRQC